MMTPNVVYIKFFFGFWFLQKMKKNIVTPSHHAGFDGLAGRTLEDRKGEEKISDEDGHFFAPVQSTTQK